MCASWHRSGWLLLAWLGVSSIGVAAAADDPLIDAVKRRDPQAVERLLTQGADPNLSQPDGATALHWAAHWNDRAIAERLLRAGARVNAAEAGGVTPLELASADGSASMVELLLKAGADPKARNHAPVLSAARSGNVEVMTLLLDHGGDVNAKEPLRGQTALMWAASERHTSMVRLLLARGADVHAHTIPLEPSGGGRGGGPGAGLGPGAGRGRTNGANRFTALLFATRAGDLESVRLLAEAGANVNDTDTQGQGAVLLAALRGHAKVAIYLLDKGADPNAAEAGYTALHWASGSWETELTATSITPDREGEEWGTVAGVKIGRLDLVKSLLQHGADPNARIKKTPARVGSSKNPVLAELEGAAPFLLAALAGEPDVMRALAENGADVRLKTNLSGTPLMAAAGLGRVQGEVVVPESATLAAAKLLFEMGVADVNAVDGLGNTALHYAAYLRRDTIVQLLVDQGAKLDVPNEYGETPMWLSELIVQFAGGGRVEVAPSTTGALLRKLGAKPIKVTYEKGLRPRFWPNVPHI